MNRPGPVRIRPFGSGGIKLQTKHIAKLIHQLQYWIGKNPVRTRFMGTGETHQNGSIPTALVRRSGEAQFMSYLQYLKRLWSAAFLFFVHTSSRQMTTNVPSPVIAIYRVKPGAEKELQRVIKQTWEAYRKEGVVVAEPHLVFRVLEREGVYCFVEIFTWVDFHAVEYPSPGLRELWRQARQLCESRDGNLPVEFQDADVVLP